LCGCQWNAQPRPHKPGVHQAAVLDVKCQSYLQVLFSDWCEHAGRDAGAEAGLATAFDAETVAVVVRDALAGQGVRAT